MCDMLRRTEVVDRLRVPAPSFVESSMQLTFSDDWLKQVDIDRRCATGEGELGADCPWKRLQVLRKFL
jgi:hypothetical protein